MIVFTDKLGRTTDRYPIVDSHNVKGGLWSVDRQEELNQIPEAKLLEGMLAYVKSLDLYYQYKESNWTKAQFNSSGIPIYTQEMLDQQTTPPEDYILVRNPDIEHSPKELSYIDTIFSAIRKLQSEVAKIKNSFTYGINSYNGTKTAMSNVLGELEEPENEPLWSLEEDDLSALLECTVAMDDTHSLIGNVVADNDKGLLTIEDAYFQDPEDGFKKQKDPKQIIFLTTTGQDVEFTLNSGITNVTFNLKDFQINQVDVYNILIVVSKKTKKTVDDSTLYGSNYVWIQVTDVKTNKVIKSGYYNKTALQPNLYEFDKSYHIEKIHFKHLVLSKLNSYTKAQDFSYDVIPSIPSEDKYKLGVAHLTIRSVKSNDVLNYVKNQLLSNELVWVEDTRSLCIKSNGKIYNIGGTNNDNTMTTAELIATLESLGIIVTTVDDGNYTLELADLTGISFIHEDTGKKFDITIDAEGNLRSTEQSSNLIADRLKNITLPNDPGRGFISNLRIAEAGSVNADGDVGLLSDRLKIGAVYAPQLERTVYGCSHAYVELENTSDQDITLDGCYLHVSMLKSDNNTEIKTIALKGVIPAGGTFLIRGKQYANFDDINTVLKVKTYDQEWYSNGSLVDFQQKALCFVLLYNINNPGATTFITDGTSDKFDINPNFIDGMWVRDDSHCEWIKSTFSITDDATTRDYVLKNTFELDPAKQAFQALHASDSSRVRGANKNDFKPFYIDSNIIEFPHSDPKYNVELITPKASFEKKNISTDKTKLDLNKPNMLYCSFGINMHNTRCFNWISAGSFDEYIWIRKQGDTEWNKFESYKTINQTVTADTSKSIYRKEFSVNINNNVYARMQGRFPGDNTFYTAHKCILAVSTPDTKTVYEYKVGRANVSGEMSDYVSDVQTFTVYPTSTVPRVYHITDQQGFYWMEYQTWSGSANTLYDKIKQDLETETFIPVIINTGDVTQNGTRINEWLDYYIGGKKIFSEFEHMSVVGNNDLCGTDPSVLGTGDDVGKSNGYYHHLFNCYEIDTENLIVNGKYIPSTYYFDCGNGTRFINVNSEITFINCRDWFGLNTNDSNVAYNIYTGWTTGNVSPINTPVYVNGQFTPIYNTLYSWLNSDKECIVSCHEIPFTVMTRENMSVNSSQPGYMTYSRSVDGKSGNLVGSHLNQITKVDNTALYWFSRLLEHMGVKIVLGGHKHTYTCTYPVREFYFYGEKNSLVDGPMEMGPDLSDEYVDGVHKVSWQYTKTDDSLLLTNSGTFESTNNDKTAGFNCFIPDNKPFNTSRLPIVKFSGEMLKVSYADSKYSTANYTSSNLDSEYLPIIGHSALENGVIYFMCQATGYKQTSNKELPGASQAFSKLLPLTQYDASKKKDTASADQQAPMFGILKWKGNTRYLQLARIQNIQAGLKKPLYNDVGQYGTNIPVIQYINCESDDYINSRFGTWGTNESNILSYVV